jgi:SanA protein
MKKRRFLRMLIRILIFGLIFAVITLGLPRLITELLSRPRIYTARGVPAAKVAIVFGAGLDRDGSPSPVLRDRVATAAELYFTGKVKKLLMSGDNRFIYYNEPGAMLEYALQLGVPRIDIVLDYAGRRTYDTCYRAKHIFKVDEAILVTQDFHLPRAVFICNSLGLPANGAIADRRDYARSSDFYWFLRELPAATAALWDVWIERPLPVMGDVEPIFPQLQLPADTTQPTPKP